MAKSVGYDPSYGKLLFKTYSFIVFVAVGQNVQLTKTYFSPMSRRFLCFICSLLMSENLNYLENKTSGEQ